jgi:hypothetical protein
LNFEFLSQANIGFSPDLVEFCGNVGLYTNHAKEVFERYEFIIQNFIDL